MIIKSTYIPWQVNEYNTLSYLRVQYIPWPVHGPVVTMFLGQGVVVPVIPAWKHFIATTKKVFSEV